MQVLKEFDDTYTNELSNAGRYCKILVLTKVEEKKQWGSVSVCFDKHSCFERRKDKAKGRNEFATSQKLGCHTASKLDVPFLEHNFQNTCVYHVVINLFLAITVICFNTFFVVVFSLNFNLTHLHVTLMVGFRANFLLRTIKYYLKIESSHGS